MALPSGYTRLNYIGTTGTQFIDTGFMPNQNTRVVIDFQSDNDACHIFGARTEFLNKGYLVCWNSDFVYSVQVANSHFNGGVFDLRARHTIDMTASEFKLDGTSMITYSVDAFQAEYNLYLASCPNSNESENMQGKIYSCKVYDNGTLIRDFIPCKNASGTVGMWDNTNSVFYANAGTGAFVEGDEYTTMPSTYTRLDYIESTGEQYINTGFAPNSNTRVVADFQKVVSANTWVLGSRVGSGNKQFDIFTETSGTGFWRIGIGGVHNNIEGVAFTDRVTADISMSLVQIGSKSMTPTVSEFTSTLPIYIFAVNNNGSAFSHSATKMYSCKIYDGETLVRKFIPCKTDSGEVGLWDDVNAVFYGNSGTGTFSYEDGGSTSGSTVGSVPVGDSIFLNVNGVPTEFIVVHQGLPSSMYDASCNGTWLMMKDLATNGLSFGTSSTLSSYKVSNLYKYGNDTFLPLLDADIQKVIKTVKIPYVNGNGRDGSVASGTNGLSTKIFSLSMSELGINHDYIHIEGAILDYFIGEPTSHLGNSTKRLAYYNGAKTEYFTRSPYSGGTDKVFVVGTDGGAGHTEAYGSVYRGMRPVFILPADLDLNAIPKGKHNANVLGTGYAVTGGRCLVNGTGYEIVKGRTLVAGTGYDVNFTRWFTITMTGSLNTSSQAAYNSYVEINGIRYSSAATVEVEEGTVIFAHIVCTGSNTYSGIFLNDKYWNTSTGANGPFYYTVKSDVSMKMQKLSSVYSQLNVYDANYQS